ncbi:hypothetical protein [Sinomonas terrae]|uniref:Uncharacterized protein n=1 Tax=Sinomonas terrae TaxID=2908838 RepID=A0ABS9U3K3_9MICC|nr:hypothetical protein [Sinomonas terrae]MCH6471279.1 hypothetical protein [Sinomonas terrae]
MAQHSASANGKDEHDSELEELGTLVLRVWKEPAAGGDLRIRILASDGAWEPSALKVTSDAGAAVKSVSDWLASRALDEHRETGSDQSL